MVQGGGYLPSMVEKETDSPIINEAGNGLRNSRGTVAMARTSDINSATAQFYVNLIDNNFLNGDGQTDGYAVFGRVYQGMDVIDRIALVETDKVAGQDNVPKEPVLIESVRRIQ
jgi:peptidyl-prolyl cis-trans isomerase A (cyclophilin A)